MMIRVDNEFLEFDELIEVEKQIKLFEEISTTDGDFSYAFELDRTLFNVLKLGNPQPDNISKPVYQKIPSDLCSNDGAELFKGFIRIERLTTKIHCSFFAGNNNWFGMLSGRLRDLDWTAFDRFQTEANLSFALFDSSGTVFPTVDNGMLAYRGAPVMKVEDFMGAIYTKDIVNKIFSAHGIKIQGELFNDVDYLSSVVSNNSRNQEQIDASSTYAEKSTTTARPVENDFYKMTFQNDSDYPYFDGANNPFDLANSIWTAPVKMRVLVEASFVPQIVDTSYNQRIYLYINGVFTFVDMGLDAGGLYNSATPGDQDTFTIKREIVVEAGTTVEVYTQWQQSTGSTQNDVLSGWLKITPVYIYKVFGNTMVPDWTQGEFIAEIFKKWNVLASYEAQNQTLTCNLFEYIKQKPAIDLSEYISETEVDYTEFISDYGKKSLLAHDELDEEEDFRKLRLNRRPYAKGEIEVNNDFLEDEVTILESKFTAPITYFNPVFGMSMEKTNLIELQEDTKVDFSAVIDSPATPGRARFTIPEDIFLLSDMARITNSTNPDYNGDYMVITLGAGYVELEGLPFDIDATGEITRLKFVYTDSDKVFLLHNVPLYEVTKFSSNPEIQIENTDYANLSLGYYNIMRTGRPVDTDLPFSMAFEDGDQVSFKDRYFRLFSRVLNDPVKIICTAHLPYHIYHQIDFLSPVKVQTEETQNVYYLNRIRGYKGSEYPCQLELIKI